MSSVENIKIDEETVRANTTQCPSCTFLMGASLEYLNPEIRKINDEKHLSLGSILASTPPNWVYLDGFAIGNRMVSNGDYAIFLKWAEENADAESGYSRFYDDPDLWRHVWSGLNFKINSLKVPVGEQTGGGISTVEENYGFVDSFIEAYLLSMKYEVEHIVGAHDETVAAVFQAIQHRLWESAQEDDSFLMDDSADTLEASPQELGKQIDALTRSLIEGYRLNVDPRFRVKLLKGVYPVETILFLQRFKLQLLKSPPDRPIPIHKVIYPRFWKKPSGAMKKKVFAGNQVLWDVQPVVGISLYEALAYTTWLSQLTGLTITLPNEAQFERASSWTLLPEPKKDVVDVDPNTKDIFPWESQTGKELHDFNYYFGQQGQNMEDFFYKNKNYYEELLENTAKTSPGGEKISMILGWGWQWTLDRYAEDELMYGRFDPRIYPVVKDRTYRDTTTNENVTVFKYRPNANIDSSYFVVRGAPDVIGGPGTVTRRFALNPLRGYQNTGFRFVTDSI